MKKFAMLISIIVVHAGLLFVVALTGCDEKKPVPPLTEGGYEILYPDALPSNAKVVEDLGNGWIVFEMTMFGEKRYFLYSNNHYHQGEVAWSFRAITELRPPNLAE